MWRRKTCEKSALSSEICLQLDSLEDRFEKDEEVQVQVDDGSR